METPKRIWQVLLLGGASGTGKTSISYRLARHFGVALTEVDDFQVVLERMTTPAQQPLLHYWRTNPEAHQLSAVQIAEHTIRVGQVMKPALEAVIANHLESQTPLVLEGDFILPALAAQPAFGDEANDGRVQGLFLVEPDEEQLVANFLQREPQHGPQRQRAKVSWHYGQWLQHEAERLGQIALPAQPWDTVFERVIAALA